MPRLFRFAFPVLAFQSVMAVGLFAQTDKPDAIIPYSFGSEWSYQRTSLDEDGKVVSREDLTYKVVGLHLIDGERWYCSDEGDFAIWSHLTDRGEEAANIIIDDETQHLKKDGDSYLFFKYPAEAGDEWDASDPADPEIKQTMLLKETELEVEVPAGKFKCHLYELSDDGTLDMRFYIAPGVGIVKFETLPHLTDAGGIETDVLTKYKLAKE